MVGAYLQAMTDTVDSPRQSQRQRELAAIANTSKPQAGLAAFVFGPIGYALLGKWALAFLCLVTFNWFLTGFLTAPLHVRRIIDQARADLDADAA